MVLVDGFYEWQWLDSKGRNKQKYLITLPDDSAFALAGIWSEWMNPLTREVIKSYSIVTTQAMGVMREVHNTKLRQPVILPVKERWQDWMNGAPLPQFTSIDIELAAKKAG